MHFLPLVHIQIYRTKQPQTLKRILINYAVRSTVFSLYIVKYSLHRRDKWFKWNIRYSQPYNFSSTISQNVAATVKWTALLQPTREVPGLNLVPDIAYPQNFSWYSSASSGQYLQLGQFSIHWSPDQTTLQTYNIVWQISSRPRRATNRWARFSACLTQ
jgi:hypothetical protein